MEPILTQEEIAGLLSVVQNGDVPNSLRKSATAPAAFLPSQSVDLFQTYERHQPSGEMRIPNLDIVLDSFARRFATSLTNALQRGFRVERGAIISTTFEQSLQELKGQGAVGIYSIAPLKYGCLFHFDPLMAFSQLEIMLGSAYSGESPSLELRQLTTIELAILRTTMEAVCADLERAFHLVLEVCSLLTKVENDFRLLNIVDPESEVLDTTFQISVGKTPYGVMHCIIPYLTLEPLREKFKSLASISQSFSTSWSSILAAKLLDMECTVTARSGLMQMNIGSILKMQAGDIINLHYNPDQPLTILVDEQQLFQAIPGEHNGKKAFHITGRAGQSPGGIHGST